MTTKGLSVLGNYAWLWRRMLGMCWRRHPVLSSATLAVRLIGVAAFVGSGLGMRAVIADSQLGVLGDAVAAAVATAVAYAANSVVGLIAMNLRMQVVERVGLIAVDGEILGDIARVDSIDHLELPEFLDRVELLRGASARLVDVAWAGLEAVLNVLQLALAMLVLGTVSPWLLLLLVIGAVPLWFDGRGRAVTVRAEKATSEDLRLQRHLFETATRPGTHKEVRVAGVGEQLVERQVALRESVQVRRFRARMVAACWQAGGWLVFTAGFAGGLAYLIALAVDGRIGAGDVVLAVTVASNLRNAIAAAVTRSTDVARSGTLLEPYLWLRDYAETHTVPTGDRKDVPSRLTNDIRLEGLGFTYAGSNRPAVRDADLVLPAGSVIAIVGEYGSGKTTLAKLLCKFHEPTAGRITIDGADLADLDTDRWWGSISGTFQDFGRYHTTVRDGIGFGDLDHRDDDERIARAVEEADASALITRMPQGLDTPLGVDAGGIDLSEGQWQKLALARSCMRREPLLFLLDEPTASLDAPSEQAIFEHFMRRARDGAARNGAVTVVISHRFSTVSEADLIIVMADGRIAEHGTHTELLASGSLYAQLYDITRTSYSATH
ncbi:ABC transporter ATP-binding protein [Streptacidiphilus griseoplanus]|uniref:ABC transporter ATP-binding protein n=1 Tax=Peterkaempfera griseoplana TaxID=66896 RepID=UPI0006E13D5E|nr:ABC transporter ATP-binding protein [Peterkaempfera griseoplana]